MFGYKSRRWSTTNQGKYCMVRVITEALPFLPLWPAFTESSNSKSIDFQDDVQQNHYVQQITNPVRSVGTQ